jgi:hypothetical protein
MEAHLTRRGYPTSSEIRRAAQVLLTVVHAPEDALPAEIDDLLEEAGMEALHALDVSQDADHWDGFRAALRALAGEARSKIS